MTAKLTNAITFCNLPNKFVFVREGGSVRSTSTCKEGNLLTQWRQDDIKYGQIAPQGHKVATAPLICMNGSTWAQYKSQSLNKKKT